MDSMVSNEQRGTKDYLLNEIGKHLAEGLAKLSIERPAQPLMWLSNYFRELAESTGETATKDKYAWDEQ